ncbi:MAG: nucleotidyltransferase family protein [Pseudomonadota bacterium]
MTDVVGILLAAGSSQRFGAHKLMQPLADGTPVGVAAAGALIAAVPNSVAVVRSGDNPMIEAFLSLGLKIVENPFADQGMGASLAAGVEANAGADGWLITLADMPWVQTETVRILAHSLQKGASMVAPVHDGRRGHPVGFARHWGDRLRALSGDEGARGLVSAHADELVLLNTSDAGVLKDIDRPHDLVG